MSKGINSFASPELNEQLKKKTVGALKPWLVDTNILGKCMLMSSKMVLYVLAHPDMCLNIENINMQTRFYYATRMELCIYPS